MSGLLTGSEFADDDGRADPRLSHALVTGDVEVVVEALRAARVLVPVVAVLGESGTSSITGLSTDKSADMALVTLRARDGRATLPVFSGADALAQWDARARPVPVATRRAALAAVQDGCELLVVDPAGAAVVVPRPALWALAKDEAWLPSYRNVVVLEAVAAATADLPDLAGVRCVRGERAELRVVLGVVPGLDRDRLDALTRAVSQALAGRAEVAEHVDSLELRVLPADAAG